MSVVERKIVRGPVCRKKRDRSSLPRARPDRLAAVTAIFRSQHELLLDPVEIAIRPAVVRALLQSQQLFGGEIGALLRPVEFRPILRQLIPAMLGYINSTGGVECEALAIADPGGEALGRRKVLPGPVRVVAPGAGARFELRAGRDPRRVERPVLDLAGIGGGAKIDKEIALPVDRKRMHRVIAGEGQPRNNDLGRRGWRKCSGR